MENDTLDSLKNLGFEGALSNKMKFTKALEGGLKSPEYTKLVHILAKELNKLCHLKTSISQLNSPDDSNLFLVKLMSFLKELGCPYKSLVSEDVSSLLKSKEDRLLLLDYMISEVMAAQIVKVTSPKEIQNGGKEIVMQESPTAKVLKQILIYLKCKKPPPNITPKLLFSKLEAKLKMALQNEGDKLFGKPLYHKSLSEKDWKILESSYREMYEEYRLKRETLIKRLEHTIQTLEGSNDLKANKEIIQSVYRPKREALEVKPNVKLSDFLAARTSLLQVEKTSSASVRKNTQSEVNEVVIGQAGGKGGKDEGSVHGGGCIQDGGTVRCGGNQEQARLQTCPRTSNRVQRNYQTYEIPPGDYSQNGDNDQCKGYDNPRGHDNRGDYYQNATVSEKATTEAGEVNSSAQGGCNTSQGNTSIRIKIEDTCGSYSKKEETNMTSRPVTADTDNMLVGKTGVGPFGPDTVVSPAVSEVATALSPKKKKRRLPAKRKGIVVNPATTSGGEEFKDGDSMQGRGNVQCGGSQEPSRSESPAPFNQIQRNYQTYEIPPWGCSQNRGYDNRCEGSNNSGKHDIRGYCNQSTSVSEKATTKTREDNSSAQGVCDTSQENTSIRIGIRPPCFSYSKEGATNMTSVSLTGDTDNMLVVTTGVGTFGPDTVVSPAVSEVATALPPKKNRKLSGAQKRKRARQKEREIFTEPTDTVREDNDDTTDPSVATKKSKLEPHPEGTLTIRRMAIVSDGGPRITMELVKYVKAAVFTMLEETVDYLPRVEAGVLVRGALHFFCDTERDVQWLRGLNGKIVRGVKLRVVDVRDIEDSPKTVKLAWKTWDNYNKDLSRVLAVMQRYNPELNTALWRVVDTDEDEVRGSVRRIVLMDQESADVIRAHGYCIHAGIDRSIFKLLDEPKSA